MPTDPDLLGGEDAFDEIGGWPGVLGRLVAGEDLTVDEAAAAMRRILGGQASPSQIAGFIVALRAKGESVGELTGLVRAMLGHAVPLEIEGDLVDTCGTGGDKSLSINVSTLSALIVAGAGARVCKHGNRAATSAAGSADVLETLGVVIDLGPAGVARCVEEAGIGFCFAPRFHPAVRNATVVRSELGIPTVFNYLGPLANPARVRHQVVGVSNPAMAGKMLGVLASNGTRRAMVVHGADGLDELSTTGPSTVFELTADGGVTRSIVDASALGLPPATLADVRGGDAAFNAQIVRRVLDGERGPHRDISVLNAAAGLTVVGMVADLADGIELASTAIDSGRAHDALKRLVKTSQEVPRD